MEICSAKDHEIEIGMAVINGRSVREPLGRKSIWACVILWRIRRPCHRKDTISHILTEGINLFAKTEMSQRWCICL